MMMGWLEGVEGMAVKMESLDAEISPRCSQGRAI